jgi:hypothetical protein
MLAQVLHVHHLPIAESTTAMALDVAILLYQQNLSAISRSGV